jgi:hypothetical protein
MARLHTTVCGPGHAATATAVQGGGGSRTTAERRPKRFAGLHGCRRWKKVGAMVYYCWATCVVNWAIGGL